MKALTWKWAFGNKRQKKKISRLLESGCGCEYCCPVDHRREKLDKIAKREMKEYE